MVGCSEADVSAAGSGAGLRGGAGLVRVGVTGISVATGGVLETGGVTASTGGSALVSGATLVMGLESTGAGTAATGGAALAALRAHPHTVRHRAHSGKAIDSNDFKLRLGIDLSFFFCKRLTEIAHFAAGRFQGAGKRQFNAERGATARFRFKFYLTVVYLYKPKGIG